VRLRGRHLPGGAVARLLAFGAALAAVAAVAAVGGRASGIDVDDADARATAMGHAEASSTAASVGLSDSAPGIRLELTPTTLAAHGRTRLALRLTRADGTSVTRLDESHDEPPLHLILVRRDLSQYRHLHPARTADGFVADVELRQPGVWRAYADFELAGEKIVLGRDLLVPGDFQPRALPAPARSAGGAGYRVSLESGAIRAGAEARLSFAITRRGERVEPEPYLGADGHLVAIREADLAYLHVHPVEGATAASVSFDAAFAEAGRYALFLQFRHEGTVRTVAFTVEVER
jgi:hypothetical protein